MKEKLSYILTHFNLLTERGLDYLKQNIMDKLHGQKIDFEVLFPADIQWIEKQYEYLKTFEE